MSIAANTTSRRSHYSHPDGALTSIQTVDVGWFLAPTNADARTIKRYIEYPANTFTQITWSGATSVTVSPGAVVKSDIITIAIPAGTKFWERTVNLTSTVTNFPVIQLPATAPSIGVDDGNDPTDKGNSGTIAASDTWSFGAASIMGSVQAGNARGFVIVGDSIAFGTGDGSSAGPAGGTGFLARSLDVHGYPYSKMTISGWQAAQLAASPTLPSAFISALSFTDVIQELGVNDLSIASRTQAQLLADHQTIYGLFTGKRIYQTTITPISTSTDFWFTIPNQTASTSGTMSLLNGVNTAIRVLPANVNVALEAADAAMSARNSDIWTAPPAVANRYTGDGTHPTPEGHIGIAAALANGI